MLGGIGPCCRSWWNIWSSSRPFSYLFFCVVECRACSNIKRGRMIDRFHQSPKKRSINMIGFSQGVMAVLYFFSHFTLFVLVLILFFTFFFFLLADRHTMVEWKGTKCAANKPKRKALTCKSCWMAHLQLATYKLSTHTRTRTHWHTQIVCVRARYWMVHCIYSFSSWCVQFCRLAS